MQASEASWKQSVTNGVETFLPEHAHQFADELWAFIVSGRSLPAYNRSRQAGLQQAQRDIPMPSGNQHFPIKIVVSDAPCAALGTAGPRLKIF